MLRSRRHRPKSWWSIGSSGAMANAPLFFSVETSAIVLNLNTMCRMVSIIRISNSRIVPQQRQVERSRTADPYYRKRTYSFRLGPALITLDFSRNCTTRVLKQLYVQKPKKIRKLRKAIAPRLTLSAVCPYIFCKTISGSD